MLEHVLYFLDAKNLNSARILLYILYKKSNAGSFRQNEMLTFFRENGLELQSHNIKENFNQNVLKLKEHKVFLKKESHYQELFEFIEYNNGIFEYKINDDIIVPKKMDAYMDILNLNSIFSIRLYEYLIGSLSGEEAVFTSNHEKSINLSLQQFRFYAGLDTYHESNGKVLLNDKYIRRQKYASLTNLIPKILKPVIDEISQKTSYHIDYYNKSSEFNKVVGFIFYVKAYKGNKQIYLEINEFFDLYSKILSEEKRHLTSKELKMKMLERLH